MGLMNIMKENQIPSEYSLKDDLKLAILAGKTSVQMLRKSKAERKPFVKTDGSPVTQQDLYSQKIIIQTIKKQRPFDKFLSEESKSKITRNGRVWIIDPIDGTTNYVMHIPFAAINIALQNNCKPIVSLTMSIFQSECLYRIGTEPIQYIGDKYSIAERKIVLIDTIPADINHKQIGEIATKLYLKKIGIRSLGSAAMGVMYVATGRADAYFAPRLHLWDIAPALHFSVESDLEIRTLEGKPWTEEEKGFCIIRKSCKQIYEALGWNQNVI